MSQDYFRKTLNLFEALGDPAPQRPLDYATVQTNRLSFGTMKIVSVGHDYSIILHPELVEAVCELEDRQHTVIRDEANTEYGVTREGDDIVFKNPRAGVNCFVERYELCDDMTESRSSLSEGCWSLPDTPEKVKGLAKLLSQPLHADAATHALYNYIGDDDLFDKIDSEAEWMDAEGVQDRDIRDLVIGWMKRNVNRYENSGIDQVLELLGEPLNELSQGKMKRYRDRAENQVTAMSRDERAGHDIDDDKLRRRERGLGMAATRIDELSKDTLGKYTKAAKDDLRNSERIYGHERAREKDPRNQASWKSQPGGEPPSEYFRKTSDKRSQGIDRAVNRLTRESGDDVMAYGGPTEYETNPYSAREVLQQARGWLEQGEDFGTIREIIMAMVDDGAVSPADAKSVLTKVHNEMLEESITLGKIVKIETAPGMLSRARVIALSEDQATVVTRFGTEYTLGFNQIIVEAKSKKADKDYDKDGKIESEKDEVMGSRMRAAKKAGNLKESGEEVWTVTYHNKQGKAESERDFTSKEAADAHAKKGNAKEKGGGKYKVTKTRGLSEADLVGLGEKSRKPKAPCGPVVEAKPDFLDMDKDGNKKETMKKAIKDKKCDEGYEGKGNHKPGWMLKADPALGKKVRDAKKASRPPLSKPSKEKLDELSNDTLNSYHDKSSEDMKKHLRAGDKHYRKANKLGDKGDWDGYDSEMEKFHKHSDKGIQRHRGQKLAAKKLDARGQLDELSKDTLKSYAKKAKTDMAVQGAQWGAGSNNPHTAMGKKLDTTRKLNNRNRGLDRVIDRLEEKVDLSEKSVSKKQQKFMGMVHAAQKGEKPASKKVADVAKTMKKGDVTDFAKTKHKGLPTKKKTDECTTAGSVAVADTPYKYQNEATMKPVKTDKDGVYESQNRKLERMIRESMNVSVTMNKDSGTGGPTKTLNINATDEDAEQLARLLNLAGLGNLLGGEGGQPEMQMPQQAQGMVVMGPPEEGEEEIEALEENMPDWPTNPETSNDPFQYSGGLNRPKSTGQTTVPVTPVAQMNHRGGMFEDVELERSLFKLYQNYKGGN